MNDPIWAKPCIQIWSNYKLHVYTHVFTGSTLVGYQEPEMFLPF
jgi:hypothetical protein